MEQQEPTDDLVAEVDALLSEFFPEGLPDSPTDAHIAKGKFRLLPNTPPATAVLD